MEEALVGRKRGKHFDLTIYLLECDIYKISIEIDEDGHDKTNQNDNIKDSLARVYKTTLIRLDVSTKDVLEYVCGKSTKSVELDIFKKKLIKLVHALLYRNTSARRYGIKLEFEIMLREKIQDTLDEAKKITDDPELKEGLIETALNYTDILDDLNSDTIIQLFKLKDKSSQDAKTLTFDEVFGIL